MRAAKVIKMAFERGESSEINWFMGTVSYVKVVDPVRWPDSPWRMLQVLLFFTFFFSFGKKKLHIVFVDAR